MPLSADFVPRIRKHTRTVLFEGYARADGLWDIEAHLTDVKPDFRKALYERFGNVSGCTHLTEVLGQFPSAAIQVLACEQRDNHDDGRKPFQLDRCHALDTGGEAVRLYYPRWRREAKTGTD